jgi:hypothetical protein
MQLTNVARMHSHILQNGWCWGRLETLPSIVHLSVSSSRERSQEPTLAQTSRGYPCESKMGCAWCLFACTNELNGVCLRVRLCWVRACIHARCIVVYTRTHHHTHPCAACMHARMHKQYAHACKQTKASKHVELACELEFSMHLGLESF